MQFTPGQYYRTRDGRKARVLATDGGQDEPIIVLLDGKPESYSVEGIYHPERGECSLDLLSHWTTASTFIFPPGYVPHNPDGLTPEQVGEGWRLLAVQEFGKHDYKLLQFWYSWNAVWRPAFTANSKETFRIADSVPLPPLLQPWSCSEDVPVGAWLKRKNSQMPGLLIVGFAENGSSLYASPLSNYTWSKLSNYLFSLDRVTWHPCVKGAGK